MVEIGIKGACCIIAWEVGSGKWNLNGCNTRSKTLVYWQRSKVTFDVGKFSDPLSTND